MNVDAFHRRLNELYLPPADRFTVVDVPEIRYAVVDGEGDPETDRGRDAVKWLHAIVHLVKPVVKERMNKRFVEPPLEAQIWAGDMEDVVAGRRDRWKWRMMVVFIDWITQEHFDDAVAATEQGHGPAPDSLRLDVLREGTCVQIMHEGDYGGLAATCKELYHDYLPANDFSPDGRYHEIYLSDPARTAPATRKVVVRQPVRRAPVLEDRS